MNQKQKFIAMVEMLIGTYNTHVGTDLPLNIDLTYTDALAYFELIKTDAPAKEKVKFTDNGKLILKAMRDNCDAANNLFKARDVAEFAFISSKSVSGAMTKLVNDGYAEVISKGPNVYSLTESGKVVDFDVE